MTEIETRPAQLEELLCGGGEVALTIMKKQEKHKLAGTSLEARERGLMTMEKSEGVAQSSIWLSFG